MKSQLVFSTGYFIDDARAHHFDDDQSASQRSLRDAKYNVEKNFTDVRERERVDGVTCDIHTGVCVCCRTRVRRRWDSIDEELRNDVKS